MTEEELHERVVDQAFSRGYALAVSDIEEGHLIVQAKAETDAKRFQAAVAALQGLIAGAQPWGWTDEERTLAPSVFGERAVEYADKLLAALAEGEKR